VWGIGEFIGYDNLYLVQQVGMALLAGVAVLCIGLLIEKLRRCGVEWLIGVICGAALFGWLSVWKSKHERPRPEE
jgi:hypothetical protein